MRQNGFYCVTLDFSLPPVGTSVAFISRVSIHAINSVAFKPLKVASFPAECGIYYNDDDDDD